MRRVVAFLLLLVVAGCGGTRAARMPVIVDTDLSNDDVIALLYLAQDTHVDLRAVAVAGTGLVHCPAGAQNTRRLLAVIGRSDIPVACGRSEPLRGANAVPDEWRTAADGLFGLTLPPAPHAAGDGAAALLRDAIETSPSRPTIIELAPMTNLAEAFLARPGLRQKVRRVVAMGGAVTVPGNAPDNPAAEVNMWVDPAAARVVARSGVPLTLVPLDATNSVPVTTYFGQALKQYHYATSAATLAWDLVEATGMDRGGSYFWDPLAAATAVIPSLARYSTEKMLEVADDGRTIVSRGGGARIATGADRVRFEHELLSVLLGGRAFAIPPDTPDATLTFTGSGCRYSGKPSLTAGSVVVDAVNRSAQTFGWAVGRLDGTHTLADLKRYVAGLGARIEPPPWFTVDASVTVPPRSRGTWTITAQLSTTGSTIFLCLEQTPLRVWFPTVVPVYGPQ